MDPLDAVLLAGTFGTLVLLGVPISFAIGLATVASMLASIPPVPALTTMAQRMATGLDSFALLAIPFFILSGQLMNRGGIARRLIDVAQVFFGRIPGGLALVNVGAAMLFGAISGSAVAAAAAIGGFMGPRMKEEGYDEGFGAAVNITSSTMGLVIPPSNILIVYSLASGGGVSIAALFLAGYLPGLLVGVFLLAVAAFLARREGYPVAGPVPLREAVLRFLDALPSLFLIVLVIGGIVAGFFTATEASAIAVLYTFVLSVIVYREVPWREIPKVLLDSASTTAIVLLLVATSMGMSWILAYTRIPQAVSAALLGVTESPVLVLLLIHAVLLVVGTFLDITPAVLVFTPIFLPVVTALGIDPLHFGIVMVMNLCIGLCTPPVGSVLFVGCGVARIPIGRVLRPLLAFYAAMIAALLLVTYLPWISLVVPRLFGT
jgi:tripartite ATP-independent transporter DctM subunit